MLYVRSRDRVVTSFANDKRSINKRHSVSVNGLGERTTRRFRVPYDWVEPGVVGVDMIIVVATSVLAGAGYHYLFLGAVSGIEKFSVIGLLAFIGVSATLAARGDYQIGALTLFYRQARDITVIWISVLLVLIGAAFTLKVAESFSRGATFTFFALGLGSMILWRGLVAQFLGRALLTGAFAPRNIVLIGERNLIAISRAILEMQQYGYNPIQIFEIEHERSTRSTISQGLRTIVDGVIEVARTERVAEIVLLIGWEHSSTIESIVEMLSVLPIPIYLLPDANAARYLGGREVRLGTTWAAEIQRPPLTRTEQFVKRCFDVTGAASMLLLLSPLMVLTALLIKLDSHGPALFFQTRNGFNGRAFRIVKFRTMHVLEDDPDTIRQATIHDSRVTRLGRWLRRTNIDELPQFFNVLYGNMSLVGPRPHAVAHNSKYGKLIANYAFRHHVKPGMTGWAQVNGYRGQTPSAEVMARRIEFDLWYINNWSIWLDIKILIRTLLVGLQPTAR